LNKKETTHFGILRILAKNSLSLLDMRSLYVNSVATHYA